MRKCVSIGLALLWVLVGACAPQQGAVQPTLTPASVSSPVAQATTAPGSVAPPPGATTPADSANVGQGGTLRYNVGTYPDNLDPHQASFTNEIIHLRMLYEGLTKLDRDLNVVGGAAESWQVSEDGLTWTFKLRPNLKFSDGTPLTARDFEYSWKRAASPQVAGQYQAETYIIEGAEEYALANPTELPADQLQALRDKVAIMAVDDTTLTIKTRQSAPHFPYVATLWIGYPVKQSIVEQGGETWWVSGQNHIGNGPFKFQELNERQQATLVPNTFYYDPPQLAQLEFRYITDTKVAYEAYRNGELDIINLVAEDLEVAQADPTLSREIVRYGGACTLGMLFNQAVPPFNNREARLAMAQSVNREQFVGDVLRGLGAPTTTWIPPGIPGHQANAGQFMLVDPTQARASWQQAGYTGELRISYASTPRNRTRFEFIAAQVQQSLGITPVLDPVEPTTMTALQKDKATFPLITLGGWCSDYPDPQNWISVYWDSQAFAERYSYSNARVDELIRQADVERDAQRRIQLYQEAEQLVLQDVAVAPLYNTENVFLVKPHVQGYATTPQDHFPGEFNISDVTARR